MGDSENNAESITDKLSLAKDHENRHNEMQSEAFEEIADEFSKVFDTDEYQIEQIGQTKATVKVYQFEKESELSEVLSESGVGVRQKQYAEFVVGLEDDLPNFQLDGVKNVKQLIREIEMEFEDGAPVDVVLETSHRIGYTKERMEAEIEKLKQKGEVYEPALDKLRTA